MSLFHPRSLRWRLVSHVTVAQTVMLAFIIAVYFIGLGALWYFGYFNDGIYGKATVEAVANALHRGPDGRLVLAQTPELARLRSEIPDMWFVVRDGAGQQLAEGRLPPHLAPVVSAMDAIAYVDLYENSNRKREGPVIGVVRWVETEAGPVKILAGSQDRVTISQILDTSAPAFILMALLTVIMALATLLATPFVVRRALKSLARAAEETARIDIDRSGVRLSGKDVPLEIVPFVTAVNDALTRLDKGYEGHKRFLADAAHELRTPIAILTTRLAALAPGPLKTRLLEDSARLTALAGQLLDLQRLEQQRVAFTQIDLVSLSERVLIDIAPLAFTGGYEMAFEPEAEKIIVSGDQMAVERALTNLVQNAIDHGGRRGTITVRVFALRAIEVSDEGNGVREAEREQIFEAFHRAKQDGRGIGLGLDLVRKIMHLHGGRAEVMSEPGQGACFRLVFPAPGAILSGPSIFPPMQSKN